MLVVAGDDVGLERGSAHQFDGRHGHSELLQSRRRIDSVDGLMDSRVVGTCHPLMMLGILFRFGGDPRLNH